MALESWQKMNSNWAVAEAGSAGAGEEAVILGSRAGLATRYTWQTLRQIFSQGNAANLGVFDHFLGAAVSTQWATALVGTGGTFTINAQQSGVARITLDTDINDGLMVTLGLHHLVSKGYTFFEARTKQVSAITVRAIEVGMSDALSETAGLAFSDHSVAGVTAVADDAVVFGYDTAASMTTWALNSVNAAGTPQAFDVGVAPSTSFQSMGLLIEPTGAVRCYLNGEFVRTITAAVATTAVLTPWISLVSLSGAAKEMDVDYIFVSGDLA